jgi:hypothetical protein
MEEISNYVFLIPILMMSLFCGLWLYGAFGPHIIYTETVTVKLRALSDGEPCFESTDLKWYSLDNPDLTWKKFLSIKPNDTLNITVSQNVFGDKSIIRINE